MGDGHAEAFIQDANVDRRLFSEIPPPVKLSRHTHQMPHMKSDTITVWSIQRLAAWAHLQKEGCFSGSLEYVYDPFREAYEWMAKQMELRLHEGPPSPKATPVWAWYQYNNSRKRKPDLRRSAHLPPGTNGVRLTLKLDRSRALLSDFVCWHHVLNAGYLPCNEIDDENFDRRCEQMPTKERCMIVRRSWNRIFDLYWDDEYVADPFEEKAIQATFWQLRLEDVAKVEEFVAR